MIAIGSCKSHSYMTLDVAETNPKQEFRMGENTVTIRTNETLFRAFFGGALTLLILMVKFTFLQIYDVECCLATIGSARTHLVAPYFHLIFTWFFFLARYHFHPLLCLFFL